MATKQPKIERLKASKDDQPQSAKEAYHLKMEVPKGAHVIVELAAPLSTIVYDQGEVPDGVLDLKFPVPDDEGDVLLRVISADKNGERALLASKSL